jgi:hypothetical protein
MILDTRTVAIRVTSRSMVSAPLLRNLPANRVAEHGFTPLATARDLSDPGALAGGDGKGRI